MCGICEFYNGVPDALCQPVLTSGNTGRASRAPTFDDVAVISDYLRVGFWEDHGIDTRRSFAHLNEIRVDLSSLGGNAKMLARTALEAWADLIDRPFVEVTRGAQIVFEDDSQDGRYLAYTTATTASNGQVRQAKIHISAEWIRDFGDTIGSYGLQTYIHEIGHALGLGHAGAYNGGTDFDHSQHFAMDSWQSSVMSYFSQSANPNTEASYAFVTTPMLADMMAIQTLYGTTASDIRARSGNNIYGDSSNAGEIYNVRAASYMVVDGGGTDHFNFASTHAAQVIDLRDGAYSSVYGETGNVTIAPGTLIENATGGRGTDRVIGNSTDNILYGGAGDDHLSGRAGNDHLKGGNGRDHLQGGWGKDRLLGGAGDDRLAGHRGDDTLFGQSGDDRLFGADGRDRLYGGAGNDKIVGGRDADILHGGEGADRLLGKSGSDRLAGEDGHDRLVGSRGEDWLSGGNGADRLRGGAGRDELFGGGGDDFLMGQVGPDRLVGGAGDDRLQGGKGHDTLVGGAGDDHLTGGPGADDFVFYNIANGTDIITDFEIARDELHIATQLLQDGPRATFQHGQWGLDLDDGGRIVLLGWEHRPDIEDCIVLI